MLEDFKKHHRTAHLSKENFFKYIKKTVFNTSELKQKIFKLILPSWAVKDRTNTGEIDITFQKLCFTSLLVTIVYLYTGP